MHWLHIASAAGPGLSKTWSCRYDSGTQCGIESMFDLSKLEPGHFETLIGQPLPAPDSTLVFKVVEVSRLRSPSPRGVPFSVILQAPPGTPAAQGIYSLQHPELGELDLFLVPVAPADGLPTFEAVFN